MKMFMIKRKTKNTSVSAALISTSASIDPPPIKSLTTTSLNRFSRSNPPTMPTYAPSPPPPDLSGYQSNPEDDKSYQSITHSISQPSRFPTVVSPDGTQSQITRFGMRKNRQIPAFNLMVLGAKMTGKSTFLHTLISTLTPSLPTPPNSSPSIVSFRPTSSLSEKHVSVTTLSGEKVLLNVIDTSGLDIHSHDDFHVDLQVNEALRFIESKFDDSLHIERQVHRNPTKLGDGHVHVAIYFIDPSTILHGRHPSVPTKVNRDISTENENVNELHMSGIDLRQLKRLSRRCNILPVIGRADELTEAELNNLKQIVRSDIKSHGIDLGLFGTNESGSESNDEESAKLPETTSETPEIETSPPENTNQSSSSLKANEEIPKKLPRRKSAVLMAPRRPFSYVMDSLHEFEKVCAMIPLSVIGAEVIHGKSMEIDQMEKLNQVNPFFNLANIDQSPSNFFRRFKWATVDVLNPNHCDFVLLRAVVLGSHFKKLKEATRLEKYEKYRTERLLARRLTMNKGLLGIEEQKRIAMEVEKMQIPHIEPTVSIFASPPTSTNLPAGNTRAPSHSKASFKSATGWRSKPSSPSFQSQPHLLYQPNGVVPSTEKFHQSSRLSSHPHTDNVNNNVPMVF